jgi:hypothetical protein
VISADRVPDAVKALHDAFDLDVKEEQTAASSAPTNPR